MRQPFAISVNGYKYDVFVPPNTTLLEVLREELGLTGTKEGCDEGTCGACTVLVDGTPWLACMTLIGEVQGREVQTVEGLANGKVLHPLQETFLEMGAVQCGFCTPGILMTAKAFLAECLSPTSEEIKSALAGNICRCTGYTKIIDAVLTASERLKSEANE